MLLQQNHYYTTKELAKLIHTSEATVRRWSDSGLLECFKTPGGHRRYTPTHVIEFLHKYRYEILPSTEQDIVRRPGDINQRLQR